VSEWSNRRHALDQYKNKAMNCLQSSVELTFMKIVVNCNPCDLCVYHVTFSFVTVEYIPIGK